MVFYLLELRTHALRGPCVLMAKSTCPFTMTNIFLGERAGRIRERTDGVPVRTHARIDSMCPHLSRILNELRHFFASGHMGQMLFQFGGGEEEVEIKAVECRVAVSMPDSMCPMCPCVLLQPLCPNSQPAVAFCDVSRPQSGSEHSNLT